ncbi:protein FAR1-RELATED SEQUENCE 5 [Ipomoea triloba]|uniref:protein FAR1-RELATED SEQUENCE 5 n=1 Tax=Ipomoea triloba TaxID=35885 RepID=UPI00125D1F2D|nr:protein FAR1-RELATED SEQUENCE 5 [Ipomoea triloba]XP_031106062.1 protein FAR1-RELATED SEQUENCE 5 [Ipomoea triloba]XP_031106063.1 protein FAR1-RELATED SEQUENCE 5 [Ipomoea triloba]XP_031106064.1 protein FAR1-RELATED SEQUENCE 5 [Ipomoea triloba]XP_031106065.1 protein FAR1-RELATED SEQUENCE 5 [Ipomoea triloba]XP_031106066.1 protein FAR1-RELATED SEQUENCE 5 [Ipomoea triloba]XP_031106067.1 protein FAR1-RELATED SEQUENCE 5 [Ipomoea triloba]XP_031106068.1 protein FAR1-RELATED SEQUENCE 5 [Ipomoea tril
MENEVIEFDIGIGGGGGSEDGDGDVILENMDDAETMPNCSPAHSSDALIVSGIYTPTGDLDLEPFDGMEFESEEAAKAFYNSYARRVGFSTRVSSSRRSRKDGAIIQRSFVCSKEGFRNLNEKRTKDREIKRPRTITRVGCKAALSVKIQDSGKWVVSNFVKEHNHELVPPDQVHCLRSHRQISGPAKTLIDTLQAAGMGPRRIMSALIKEYGGISKVGFTEVDCRNYMRNNRQRSLEGDTQLLLDYLRQMHAENPDFFYAVQGDEDQCTGNVFWADHKARANYNYFGDTVTFDTTYRSNRYRLPFAPFTGINHHGQPVLFGCAFLINESEASFIWLFKTWLAAMFGNPPVSITTDHDEVIRSAIMQVFPESRHRFCKWHIFKKCQEKLSHVFLKYPNFEADFHKCVNLTESTEEYESCWFSLVSKYELRDHDWLQAIYSDRRHWVPVYLRDTFFAEMSITQRSDSMNSYFDGYVNASTNLNQFFKLYEKALDSRHEKEVKADYDTMNTLPALKTPSPMEKQASEVYTRKIFMRFQEELVGTLTFMATKVEDEGGVTIYQVAKFGEDHKAYCVRFNVLEMKATCSCQMFEFSGLLCRHVLAVFRVTNVLTLPSHYILKRWTRNAKSTVTLEERVADAFSGYLESHTVRYNMLRHEAFKFVEDGAESVSSYVVAMAALGEASKKVSLAAKHDGKISLLNGRNQDDSISDGIQENLNIEDQHGTFTKLLSEDDVDRKIHELTCELDCASRRCEVYRVNLLSVLKDIEDHKQQLSIKVQNIKISMKDDL